MTTFDSDIKPHDRFSSVHVLTSDSASQMAIMLGDDNPIHHDEKFASTTRYKRLIASGAHTTGLLLALTASYFSKKMSMVGLDFQVFFKRPIYSDETITLEWLIIRVAWNEKLQGKIIDLRGRILGEDGKTSLGAAGKILITDSL